MHRRILVPVDGSDTAARGLDEAIVLAKAFDARLVLLSVVESFPVMMELSSATSSETITNDVREHMRRVLDDAKQVATAAGLDCEACLEEASVSRVCDVIVDQTRERRCDLIVMGTHGRRGLAHALLGSDAERVLRQAPCPVLMVRGGEPTEAAKP